MSLLSKLMGELVDVVEYPDAPRESLVYRFARYANQIKYGAKLIVREGQGAAFVNEGKLADVFEPGTYTLETRNLPILSTLQGWKYGFTSPFKAEVYFFSMRPVLNQQWGTQQAITMELAGYGLSEIRAYGQASYRITDPTVFLREMVGVSSVLNEADLLSYLRGVIVAQFSQALTASQPTAEQLLGNLNPLDDSLLGTINLKLKDLGFQLTQFLIENLSLPPALRKELFEYSRLNNVDMAKFTQFQAAKAIGGLAGNADGGGGMGAQGMQLGVGMAAASQIMKDVSFTGTAKTPAADTPPPLDKTIENAPLYYVAIEGKAEGPLSAERVSQLAQAGALNAATLVWQPGMPAWTAAGTQSGLQHLFAQTPPPLPSA
jgi:membrane protease subunit (stomatin/prohibitin family)